MPFLFIKIAGPMDVGVRLMCGTLFRFSTPKGQQVESLPLMVIEKMGNVKKDTDRRCLYADFNSINIASSYLM